MALATIPLARSGGTTIPVRMQTEHLAAVEKDLGQRDVPAEIVEKYFVGLHRHEEFPLEQLRPHSPKADYEVAGRSWREKHIDNLLEAVSGLGMTMSRSAAGDLLDERVQFVANQMRVTPATARTYLTDEALAGMAREIVFGFVAETPGADLMSAPRTSAVPVRFLGRVVAGLGEVQRILMVERDDLEHTRDRVAQIAHTQSHLGLLLTDEVATIDFYDEPSIQMPPALLLRAARSLETAADLVEAGLVGYEADPQESAGLPSAFRRDVDLLRTMASQEDHQ